MPLHRVFACGHGLTDKFVDQTAADIEDRQLHVHGVRDVIRDRSAGVERVGIAFMNHDICMVEMLSFGNGGNCGRSKVHGWITEQDGLHEGQVVDGNCRSQ